ncbi:hypothetical protein E2I00_002040 [Balaenoptera physalus]|uniref:Rap-GAP domain-containing protein n=1 Tax=Balaenoptera physalus TaxID=9770 RepID=A0A6A1QG55_BALPH|nr:hypothetical protein E2I00_002040 [Balaenoptera physalus]
MVQLPDDPEHPDIFQLNNPDKGNVYKFQTGSRFHAILWHKHLDDACKSNRPQTHDMNTQVALRAWESQRRKSTALQPPGPLMDPLTKGSSGSQMAQTLLWKAKSSLSFGIQPLQTWPTKDPEVEAQVNLLHNFDSLEGVVLLSGPLTYIMLISSDADGAIQRAGRFRVENGSSDENATALPGTWRRTDVHLENPEYHTRWYFKYFLGQVHQNYIGNDAEKSPFFLSVTLSDQNNQRVPQYRAILWRKTFPPHCGSLCPFYFSAMNLDKFEKGPREIFHPEIQKDLLVLEEQEHLLLSHCKGSVNFKFGVLFAKDGQLTDDDMFSNEIGSDAFQKFLNLLGDTITLKGWTGYRGGLDTKNDTTGIHSVYTIYQGHEIMFHVSTMLPYSKENKQQVERKRHIGNDIVTIVFQEGEEPSPAFKPSMIRSHFTRILSLYIFALVRYDQQKDNYRQLNKFKIQILVIFEEKPSNSAMFSTQAENIFRGKRTTLWPTLALPTGVYRPPGIQGLFASEM